MRKFTFLLGFLCVVMTGFGQSHGLEFLSHEVIPEKRTSLRLAREKPFCFQNSTEISFDLKFRAGLNIYFGYVMRLVTNDHLNIDLIYNERLRNFNFIIGEKFSAVFTIDSAKLFGDWTRLTIRMDCKAQEASLFLNQKQVAKGKANCRVETCYRVFFGANDFEGYQTTDIPPMRIRDICIREEGREEFYFPLSETEGNVARDARNKISVVVQNPIWLKPRYQQWENVLSIKTKGTASIAFNKNAEMLYIVSPDSLYELSLKNLEFAKNRLSKDRDTLLPGNQSIYDPAGNKLYNFYIDTRQVSTYDPSLRAWSTNFLTGDLTVFWHANKFISHVDSSLYILGGYGQLQYKNLLQRYHFSTGKWDTVHPTGDFFMPRYLAALGTNQTGDTAYVIGGYGSNTGDQTINPKHNYDLLAYSVKGKTFHLVYHLKEPQKQFCFTNSLILDPNGNDYYTLTYPNDRFNSSLQLIKGSLRTPTYELLGDSIPYFFYDVESFADLYYCPVSSRLVAVTLHTSKNNVSTVNVFTIDFPPNKLVQPAVVTKDNRGGEWLFVAGAVLIAGLLFLTYFIRRRRRSRTTAKKTMESIAGTTVHSPVPNKYHVPEEGVKAPERAVIYTFGRFEAFDKNGTDITTQFTPLLKELFLMVLLYTIRDGKGISMEKLYEKLWSDKPVKDAKNNYSVNIVKLKAILEKIGDCHIGRESGKLRFEILNESMRIDYREFTQLISSSPVIDKTSIHQLIAILQRGSFLNEVHYDWLDEFKAQISGSVIDIMLEYLHNADMATESDLIIRIANIIFFFDQLNEAALEYKCRALIFQGRHGMAREVYLKFAKEYKENYGLEFEKTFLTITGHE